MAILQLSRITHRKGLEDDIPQLAGAELGWVLDNRKLYIGNGEIIEGAPVVGNTEILTEYSDILGLAASYTYKGTDAGYVVETGPLSTAILRSIQGKFDDFVSVKDFGAFGDAEDGGAGTDDTEAINRALNQLFCNPILALNSTNNPQARRSLYFPAGLYKVTGNVKVPPHARIWGEGLTSSIIKFFRADDISVSLAVEGERYQVSFVGDTIFGGLAVDDIFIGPSVPLTGTGTIRAVPAVIETANNLQQTGLQINNGDQLPIGIEIASMGVETTQINSLLKLNSVSNSSFSFMGLTGPRTLQADVIVLDVIDKQTAAVELEGVVSNITLSKLITRGTSYALKATGDVKGVVLENSGLDLHYKGVYVTNPVVDATAMVATRRYKIVSVGDSIFTDGGAAFNREGETFVYDDTTPVIGTGTVIDMADAGPTGVVVSRNIMNDIAQEGVHYENVLFNSTGYNVFYNVGNDLGATAVSPNITFETDQCVSVGDLFEREDETLFPRVSLAGNGGIYLDNSHSIHLGAYERQVGIVATLKDATTDTVFTFSEAALNSFRVDYSITLALASETRMGRIYVSNNGSTVTFNDEFTESAPTGIELNVVVNPSVVTASDLEFTSTAGEDAQMAFSVVRLD